MKNILVKNQKGMALVTILVLLMLLSLIGSTALFSSNTGKKISANYRYAADALQNADAGIADAARQLLNKTIVGNGQVGWTQTGSTTGFTNSFTVSYVTRSDNAGNKTIALDPTGKPYYQIDSVGYSSGANGVEKRILAVIKLNSTGSPFNNGVFGKDYVHFNGNGYVDSYQGTWERLPGKRRYGDTGTNNEIKLNGNGGIYGKGLAPVISNILGEPTEGKVERPEQELPIITAPSSGDTWQNKGGEKIPGGEWQVWGDQTISTKYSITGSVTMVINGSLTIQNKGEISIDPGASLTLYVKGNISIQGKGIVNSDNNQNSEAKNVIIYGTKECASIKLSGQGEMYGVVYAPDAQIDFSGLGEIFGAVIGKNVSVNGSGNAKGGIHYDESLKNFGGGGGPPDSYKMISWKEL